MIDQTKNILIGLFVVAAFAIIVFMLMFLHPSMGNEGQTITVRFANIDKVNVGTRVLFAGHPVGEVASIKEVENAREMAENSHGIVYVYQLTLKIDTGISVYTTDDISVKTSGLLGEKSVAITPMPQPPGTPLVLVKEQIMYASSPESVEDVMKTVNTLAEKAQVLVTNANSVLDDIKHQEIVTHVADVLKNVKSITAALDQPELLDGIIKDIRKFTLGLNDLQPVAMSALENFDLSMKDLDITIRSSGKWIAGLDDKRGLFYKIFHEDDLYLRIAALLNKAETVIDDMSHYGLLYQNDKGWQRLRARRMNLLQELSCPAEFRNFFNDEIDEILTSLTRVHMVLQEGEDCGCFPACSPEFNRVLAELLRRVEGLEKNIKMYNTQVMDLRENCGCYESGGCY